MLVYRVIAAVRSPLFGEIRLLFGYASALNEYQYIGNNCMYLMLFLITRCTSAIYWSSSAPQLRSPAMISNTDTRPRNTPGQKGAFSGLGSRFFGMRCREQLICH